MRHLTLVLFVCCAAAPCKGESASFNQLTALPSFGSSGSAMSLERLREESAFEAGVRPEPRGIVARAAPSQGSSGSARKEPRKRAIEAGAVLLGLAGLVVAGPVGLLTGAAVGALLGAMLFIFLG